MKSEGVILIAEDDPNDALLFQCALARSGVERPVFFVPDGQEARKYLLGVGPYNDRKQFPAPAMLVLDVLMPRLGGLELLEWARAQPEFADLFIVVLTGLEQRGWMERAYELGANLYMVKPLKFSDLAGVIACAALAGSKATYHGGMVPA